MGTRYVGIAKETTFGAETESSNLKYSVYAESSLDVANDTAIELKRGLGRGTNQMDAGVYIPSGDVTMALTVSSFPTIAYGIGGNYKYVNNTHKFWNTDGLDCPSYQIAVGKDIIEHLFVGCKLNTLNITCDKEYADFTANYICKKDLVNGDAKEQADINDKLFDEKGKAIPFSKVTITLDNTDITSAKVINALAINIENGTNGEDGVGLGDIYTKRILLGELSVAVDFENLFTDDTFITMFKEAGYHTLSVKFTDKDDNYVEFYFPSLFLSKSEQTVSGRESIKQPLSFKAMAGSIEIDNDTTINTEFVITVKNSDSEYTF